MCKYLSFMGRWHARGFISCKSLLWMLFMTECLRRNADVSHNQACCYVDVSHFLECCCSFFSAAEPVAPAIPAVKEVPSTMPEPKPKPDATPKHRSNTSQPKLYTFLSVKKQTSWYYTTVLSNSPTWLVRSSHSHKGRSENSAYRLLREHRRFHGDSMLRDVCDGRILIKE